MSYVHDPETGFLSFEPFLKTLPGSKRYFQAHLMPTRSNTPEDTSPSKWSQGNSSDRDSFYEANTPTSGSASKRSYNAADDYYDYSAQFEIDVRPKRRKFNNIQERILFVEDYKRKYKTEMCKNWELRGTCKFGDKCCFAHGRHELKGKALTHVKYKTKPCKQYHQAGFCPYGQRCQYLHREALSPNIFFCPLEEKSKQNYYTYDMLHEVNVICTTDADLDSLFENLPQRY
jgi:hypothetical protein